MQTNRAVISSATNYKFPNIGPLGDLEWPDDFSGYGSLRRDFLYHPVQPDATLSFHVEADAIRACHNLVVTPVNLVLAHNPYRVRHANGTILECVISSVSEDSHTVHLSDPPVTYPT